MVVTASRVLEAAHTGFVSVVEVVYLLHMQVIGFAWQHVGTSTINQQLQQPIVHSYKLSALVSVASESRYLEYKLFLAVLCIVAFSLTVTSTERYKVHRSWYFRCRVVGFHVLFVARHTSFSQSPIRTYGEPRLPPLRFLCKQTRTKKSQINILKVQFGTRSQLHQNFAESKTAGKAIVWQLQRILACCQQQWVPILLATLLLCCLPRQLWCQEKPIFTSLAVKCPASLKYCPKQLCRNFGGCYAVLNDEGQVGAASTKSCRSTT